MPPIQKLSKQIALMPSIKKNIKIHNFLNSNCPNTSNSKTHKTNFPDGSNSKNIKTICPSAFSLK